MTENCGSCKFYRDRDIRGGVMSGHGACYRYPEAIKTNDGKWCGEHMAVEARDPEAAYRKLQRVLVQSPVASQEYGHRGDDVHPVEAEEDTATEAGREAFERMIASQSEASNEYNRGKLRVSGEESSQ